VLLEGLSESHERLAVVRLAALSDQAGLRLSRRGIRPESIPEILRGFRDKGIPFSTADLINSVFAPNYSYPTPFNQTRFSDGTFAVSYSALEEETCVEEIKYHRRDDLEMLRPGKGGRFYYRLFQIRYEGRTVSLFDLLHDHPEIATNEGYQFCRSLGREAVARSKDAFRTPSARRSGGVCVPVFRREALGDVHLRFVGCFELVGATLTFRRL
jgi:hypothetical protein